MTRIFKSAAAILAITIAPAAHAADDDFEFWLNPSVAVALDSDTELELETAQRFRDSGEGRPDTYFVRGWVKQKVASNITLAGAIEKRVNDGGSDELRTIQQISTKHGLLRTRLRLEERFVEDRGGRMGLRLRPRLGVSVPLGDDGRWSADTNAELSWTLRGTSPGGDTGLTGLRTQIGVGYAVSDTLEISVTYLRQQDFEDNAPDQVGHAPLIGIGFAF